MFQTNHFQLEEQIILTVQEQGFASKSSDLFNYKLCQSRLDQALLKEKITPVQLVTMTPDEMIRATGGKRAKVMKDEKAEQKRRLVRAASEVNIAQKPIAKLVNDDYVEIIVEYAH